MVNDIGLMWTVASIVSLK